MTHDIALLLSPHAPLCRLVASILSGREAPRVCTPLPCHTVSGPWLCMCSRRVAYVETMPHYLWRADIVHVSLFEDISMQARVDGAVGSLSALAAGGG